MRNFCEIAASSTDVRMVDGVYIIGYLDIEGEPVAFVATERIQIGGMKSPATATIYTNRKLTQNVVETTIAALFETGTSVDVAFLPSESKIKTCVFTQNYEGE